MSRFIATAGTHGSVIGEPNGAIAHERQWPELGVGFWPAQLAEYRWSVAPVSVREPLTLHLRPTDVP